MQLAQNVSSGCCSLDFLFLWQLFLFRISVLWNITSFFPLSHARMEDILKNWIFETKVSISFQKQNTVNWCNTYPHLFTEGEVSCLLQRLACLARLCFSVLHRGLMALTTHKMQCFVGNYLNFVEEISVTPTLYFPWLTRQILLGWRLICHKCSPKITCLGCMFSVSIYGSL